MQRVDNSTAATTLPTPAAAGTPGYFTGGDPLVGAEATIVDQDWMNSVQEELCNVIAAARPVITLDKTNRSQLLQALNQLFVSRTVITADTTLYVNPSTGNDNNDGLTAGSAFQTIRAAISAVYDRYNWNGYQGTIQLADGTYTYNVTNDYAARFVGQPIGMPYGGLTLLGNTGNPDAVQITATNSNAIGVTGIRMTVNGVSVTGTGTTWTLTGVQGMGVSAGVGGWIEMFNMRAKNCGMFPFRADNGGIIAMHGSNNKVTGTSQYGIFSGVGGMFWAAGASLDVTGMATTYGTFVTDQGRLELSSMTFLGSGSCTGPRYLATNVGCIITGGGGATYLPGSTAGSVATGGQYS